MSSTYRRPEKTMVYIYRRSSGNAGGQDKLEYLLLQRSQSQVGPIWQPVVGAARWNEELVESAKREVFEETGITRLEGIMAVGYAFSFTFRFPENSLYAPGVDTIRNVVFAAQVRSTQSISLSDEHVDYGWFSYEEALAKLYWPEDRKALVQLDPMINQA
jgi:dATP pyrophosphohydrolase